jgi:hypothetical protein
VAGSPVFPLLGLLVFASGAAALAYEVAWLRSLILIFGSSAFAVSTVVTSFMAGLAVGSYVAAVSLTDGTHVVARRLAGTATFTTDIDHVTIENGGSTADYEIELPRNAVWVEIRVGPRRLLVKEGPRVVTDAPVGAGGRYLLPLTPPGR